MKNKEDYINQILNGFQKYKGRASTYCFSFNIIPELVYNILYRFKRKNGNAKIFIAVDTYNTRKNILDYINKKGESYNIDILSKDYIDTNYKHTYNLIISVGINNMPHLLRHFYYNSTFTIAILTENIMDENFNRLVFNLLPRIYTDDIVTIEKQVNLNSPVEGRVYNIDLTKDELELYKKYTNDINLSVSIFGNIDNIHKAIFGDKVLGISAVDFVNQLAKENGWSYDIDCNIDFQKKIDETYNPNSLTEKAETFFNISRSRRELLANNKNKFPIIADICNENKDKKILIISKNGEYAAKITKYINENTDCKCGDYHDCIEHKVAVDINGNPILYKSGLHKGEPKILASKAQSSLNEQYFNQGYINVLSIKESSFTSLKIVCDLIIITTPLYSTIKDIKTRFNNIKINSIPNKVIIICYANTIENEKLEKWNSDKNITLINENENFVTYDENNGDIIL